MIISKIIRLCFVIIAIGILLRQLVIQHEYMSRSLGDARSPGTVLLRGASGGRLVSQLDNLGKNKRNSATVTTIGDIGFFSLAALQNEGSALIALDHDFFGHLYGIPPVIPSKKYDVAFADAFAARSGHFRPLVVDFGSGVPADELTPTDDRLFSALQNPDTMLLAFESRFEALNHFWAHGRKSLTVIDEPLHDLRNRLLFYPSSLGPLRDYSPEGTLSFPEQDPFFPDRWFQGINRYMVLAEINVPANSHFLLSFTRTPYDRGAIPLPSVSIVGERRTNFGFVGRGSGRLFAPVFKPKSYKGLKLVLLDMGVDGKPHSYKLPGLFSLFNAKPIVDLRHLAAYARDISIVPDSVFRSLVRPTVVNLPRDLDSPYLEYSGIYEDGWISPDSRIILGTTEENGNVLYLRGNLPKVAETDVGEFSLDVSVGKIHKRFPLQVGDFSEKLTLPSNSDPTDIRMHFTHPIRLDGDGRIVGGFMSSIGFEQSVNDLTSDVPRSSDEANLKLGLGWFPLERFQGETFRWSANDGQIIISTHANSKLHLSVAIEGGPAVVDSGRFDLALMNGTRLISKQTITGRSVVSFPINVSSGKNVLTLHVNSTNKTVGEDPRVLSYRVFGISCSR